MALPESGNTRSNVTKLEDSRNKHKKSTRTTKSHARSQKVDETHKLTSSFEKDADPPGEIESIKERTKPELVEQDVNTEIIKTPAKHSTVSNRRFDKVKVAQIKTKLVDDSYEINYLQVADKFIEHERFG